MNFIRVLTLLYIIICHENQSVRLNKYKGAVKTYENEYGDIFDCVNLYHQPAFDHPLLINHTILNKPPAWLPKNSECKVQNERNSTYRCPEGTIPILRSHKHDVYATLSTPFIDLERREYAFVETKRGGDRVFGASAVLDVWKPSVQYPEEYSLSEIMIVCGHGTLEQISIEAGWIVYEQSPRKSPPTRFFIRSKCKVDDPKGGFNLGSCGFVQVSNTEIGGALPEDKAVHIMIFQDGDGNWMLYKDCILVGYWPYNFFLRSFTDGAEQAIFGGEVVNYRYGGLHTKTAMGNGRYGTDGEGISAEINFIQKVKLKGHDFIDLGDQYQIKMNKRNCYNAIVQNSHPNGGFTLYYGGPGFNRSRPCIL